MTILLSLEMCNRSKVLPPEGIPSLRETRRIGAAYPAGEANPTGVDSRLEHPVILPPELDLPAMAGATVLVVDDCADSGRTLKLVMDLLAPHVKQARSAVLYEKPASVVRPDNSWRITDRWIVFPWSAQPPVVRTGIAIDL